MPEKELKKTGAPTLPELEKTPGFPALVDWEKGSLAFIECVEEIPCNPCEAACPRGAISVGRPITNLPVLDTTKCAGCGLCISQCPGLAIVVREYAGEDKESTIMFPYEYHPLPEVGQSVAMVDREGVFICRGRILEVNTHTRNMQTPVIRAAYPAKHFLSVISIRRLSADR